MPSDRNMRHVRRSSRLAHVAAPDWDAGRGRIDLVYPGSTASPSTYALASPSASLARAPARHGSVSLSPPGVDVSWLIKHCPAAIKYLHEYAPEKPITTSSHSAKRLPGHNPRPPNAFMLYRSYFCVAGTHGENKHNLLSKRAGEEWGRLSAAAREPFIQAAELVKKRHADKFPDYKYVPTNALVKKPARRASGSAPARPSRTVPALLPEMSPTVVQPEPWVSAPTWSTPSPAASSASSPVTVADMSRTSSAPFDASVKAEQPDISQIANIVQPIDLRLPVDHTGFFPGAAAASPPSEDSLRLYYPSPALSSLSSFPGSSDSEQVFQPFDEISPLNLPGPLPVPSCVGETPKPEQANLYHPVEYEDLVEQFMHGYLTDDPIEARQHATVVAVPVAPAWASTGSTGQFISPLPSFPNLGSSDCSPSSAFIESPTTPADGAFDFGQALLSVWDYDGF